MPWFKVDDNLAFHHKVVAAGNAAIGLWARAGSWCAQNLTDGFVPDHMLARLGTQPQVDKLVKVGLWTRVEGGIEFHQWANRQPLRTQIEAEREASRARMASVRAAKKGVISESSQVSESRSPEVQRTGSEAFGNPDPTRPNPTPVPNGTGGADAAKKGASRKRPATRLPNDWKPTEQHWEKRHDGIDVQREAEKFRLHAEANDRRQVSWNAAFSQWLLNARPSERPATVRHLPSARDVEQAPDGLSDEEYAAWWQQRAGGQR